jgi:hypothetical protein
MSFDQTGLFRRACGKSTMPFAPQPNYAPSEGYRAHGDEKSRHWNHRLDWQGRGATIWGCRASGGVPLVFGIRVDRSCDPVEPEGK